jgi:hypothetical protein
MIRVGRLGLDGKVHEGWDYDPTYQPPMPRSAVRGDIRKQNVLL